MRSKLKQQFPRNQLATSNFTRKLIMGILLILVAMVILNSKRDGYQISPDQNHAQKLNNDGQQATPPAVVNNDLIRYHDKQFKVVKVIDGDTFDINLPNGKYKTTRIRLLGVDTPEKASGYKDEMYYGNEATKFTKTAVYKKSVTIKLDTTGPSRGKYGRLLCYVYTDKTTMLNKQIIINGFGYSDPRFKHLYKTTFTRLERRARKGKIGLWQKITRSQLPYYHQQTALN
jgi:micrococcal nuclease